MRVVKGLLISGLFFCWGYASKTLWYTSPATNWEAHALPLGNGFLGGMTFGQTTTERIQFNENSLWTGDKNNTGHYQNFGDLFISLSHNNPTEYKRELDLRDAVHRTEYINSGNQYHREYFSSYPDRVMVFRFTANNPSGYSGYVELVGAHSETSSATGNKIRFGGILNNGQAYEAQAWIIQSGGTLGIQGDRVTFSNSDTLIIFLAATTDYVMDYSKNWKGPNPRTVVESQLQLATSRSYNELKSRHVIDYDSLFSRLDLNLGVTSNVQLAKPTDQRLIDYGNNGADSDLEELMFHFGRYLLIASSRPGSLPTNLQGLWNDDNNPPWRSDYHSDINVAMNYWPAEVTNLAECHQPFLNYINSLRQVRTELTNQKYGTRGWTIHTENGIFGGGSWHWNNPGGAWYAQHLWEHYSFGQDKGFLENFALPIFKELILFWRDHTQLHSSGYLVAKEGISMEHGPGLNGPPEDGTTYDHQLIWDLLTNTIETLDTLKKEEAYKQELIAFRDSLMPNKIGSWGQLQEWLLVDRDDQNDHHRHLSHLIAVHPGRQISVENTPVLAAAAEKSLLARGDANTGWAMAWQIGMWARFGKPENSHRHLRYKFNPVLNPPGRVVAGVDGSFINLFAATWGVFQIDANLGYPAGVAEMLLQSHLGELHILPALPKEWPTGSISGLRARGGYKVNIKWNNSELEEVYIEPSGPNGIPDSIRLEGVLVSTVNDNRIKVPVKNNFRSNPNSPKVIVQNKVIILNFKQRGDFIIDFLDISGRVIENKQILNSSALRINTDRINPGIYLLIIHNLNSTTDSIIKTWVN